jgi:transcriptional regulator with XRE-family HTH domain
MDKFTYENKDAFAIPKGRIKKLREAKKLRQKDMNVLMSCTLPHYIKMEHGTSIPSSLQLHALANILGVSVDYLLGKTDFSQTIESGIGFVDEINNVMMKVAPILEKLDSKYITIPRSLLLKYFPNERFTENEAIDFILNCLQSNSMLHENKKERQQP